MRSLQDTTVPVRQGFAKADDGVELFWRVVGQGDSAIACCNGIGVSTFFWEYLVRRFAPEHQVLLWDYRSHGRSGAVSLNGDLSIARHARDLGAVLADAGLERAVLAGHSMGAQVILERYRQAPQEVAGLISVLGTYGHPLDTFGGLSWSRQLFDVALHLMDKFPRAFGTAGKLIVAHPAAFDAGRLVGAVDRTRLSRHDLRQYLHHLTVMGFPLFFAMARQMGEHSARDLLPTVRVPVLVVAAERDSFTPPRLSRELDAALPDSELIWLEGATHAGIVEQPEVINAAVARFLAERVSPPR